MKEAHLKLLISKCIAGDISPADHDWLQQQLKSDAHARALFREYMDLEVSLRTWAAESGTDVPITPPVQHIAPRDRTVRLNSWYVAAAIAASVMLTVLAWWSWPQASKTELAGQTVYFGTLLQQRDSSWRSPLRMESGSRFTAGTMQLDAGIAEMKFDSGTHIVMQGPCELQVTDGDTAKLIAGRIVVRITELSDGFILQTPDALILDEGTEYAVSVDDHATEVHVFEGTVIWQPKEDENDGKKQSIASGEARRYIRNRPDNAKPIPLGKSQFARQIEADLQETTGKTLVAYDGFENLAEQIQHSRSGFGWLDGWRSGFGGRHGEATIVEAPKGTVFGIQRTGLRLLRFSGGKAMRRELEKPMSFKAGDVIFLSFLLQRHGESSGADRFLQVSLCDDDRGSGRRSRRSRRSQHEIACGVTSDGFPFTKTYGSILQSASAISDGTAHLFVAKIVVSQGQKVKIFLRVFNNGDTVGRSEPTAWTTVGETEQIADFTPSQVRIAVGERAVYDIDELKIGTTWYSVTTARESSSQ